jgi:hypothetical protein
MRLLNWFSHLPRITQSILIIGILALLMVIALNHTAEGNITNLLLVVQTVMMSHQGQKLSEKT